MNQFDDWMLALMKWAAGAAAAAGVAWTALQARVAALEKHKADAATVAVMANDLKHIRHAVDRLERHIDRENAQ